ncbi:MAG: LysM peptidoglycan-binding domain-containing protein, partial [Halobacteriales archaeon]|nr:LysM peptidoglycan-binding domain-containing protein [Halobacteriales archaeon]
TTVLLLAGAVSAHENPPPDLKLVGDHWTAWDPPTEFPEGAQLYTIQRGDTLWDLAAEYLGDPYLWPQLWERNQYILDAHWIYPGDPLVISVEVVPVETLAEVEVPVVEEPEEDGMMFDLDGGPPETLGSESDIYCSGFIGDPDHDFPFSIVGSEAAALAPTIYGESKRKMIRAKYGVVNTLKDGLATSDIVYLDGGRGAGMSPGDVFTMVDPRDIVRHPLSGEKVGRFYRYLGRVRVLSVQPETAIAEISHSCHPATIGAQLMPFVPEPVPLARRTAMRPVNMPASNDELAGAAAIVHIDHSLLSMGEGNVVHIDRGAIDDVTPGDIYTIYRRNVGNLPAVVMGELAVLSVHEETAVARILSSRYTVRLGDRLVIK